MNLMKQTRPNHWSGKRSSASRSIFDPALRYALAVGSVVLATVVTRQIQPWMGESISPLFFAAVMLSAWFGGLGPGLLATVLAGWASAYFFLNPPGSALIGWDDIVRLCVFLMVALLISFLTAMRNRAETALRRSHEELERRVQLRTAELKTSIDSLRESEERFRLMVEGVADYAIVMLNSQGRVISWNAGAERIHGYGPGEIVGRHFSCFFPRDDVQKGKPDHQLDDAGLEGRQEDEGWRIRKDGSRFWASVITTALRGDGGGLRGFAQVTRDITELRRLEREVLEISEQEQRRVGHDLHDGLGQELTGLAFLSQNLGRKLADKSLPEAADAQRIESLTNKAIEQTRELARGFSPVELGPDGLPAALRELANKVEGVFHVPCELESNDDIRIPDDAASLHLYRIAQEAVNNAVKHSKATRIRIALGTADQDTALSVTDNGIGLPGEEFRGKGMGLSLMLYRARAIGASLDIRSAPAGGTVVSCTYPDPEAFKTALARDILNDERSKTNEHAQEIDLQARQEPVAHPAG